jgi:hypothetical protein
MNMATEADTVSRDLLIGAEAIASYLRTIIEEPVTAKTVFYWAERDHIPTRRIGARIVASKRRLRQHLGAG